MFCLVEQLLHEQVPDTVSSEGSYQPEQSGYYDCEHAHFCNALKMQNAATTKNPIVMITGTPTSSSSTWQ